jgi:selenocysteine lyase/cysteine desulfurase
VCLRRAGKLADEMLGPRLLEKGIVASVRKGIVRISPHWFNTETDIDKLYDTLKLFAVKS